MGILTLLKSLFTDRRVDIAARFELLRTAVAGTMSSFHQARDCKSGQVVGLKIIDPDKSAAFETLFRGMGKPSEGEIISQLDHPGIVKVLEYGTTLEDRPYLVMEYVEGTALNSLIGNRSPLLIARRISLVRGAAEALAAVHEGGFVHRDVCPRNFIVDGDGDWIKLIDFGLSLPAVPRFLQRGDRSGVPRYLAPEILRQKTIDHRADLFSFGVTAFEICALQHPWEGEETSGKVALDLATAPPAEITRFCRDINPRLAGAIMQCLAVDPDDRPASVREFLRAIRGLSDESL